MKFRKVAILGTGLLGASFAFAAKNRGLCEKISAWSRSESTRKKCSILPEIFDEVFDSPERRKANYRLRLFVGGESVGYAKEFMRFRMVLKKTRNNYYKKTEE